MAYKVGRCLLRELLQSRDMTQSDLADRLAISEQQINKYVNNRQGMSLQVAKNIASILSCHIENLYEWIEVGRNE